MHQVRRWDAEMCTCTERHDGAKPVYSVAAAPAGSQLVAFGGAERALHIWDPRTPTGKEKVRHTHPIYSPSPTACMRAPEIHGRRQATSWQTSLWDSGPELCSSTHAVHFLKSHCS